MLQVAFDHFKALDERINFVATKVVHLGDQLEGVNTPRTRAVEAQLLMKYFSEFMEDNRTLSHVFTDPFQVCTAVQFSLLNFVFVFFCLRDCCKKLLPVVLVFIMYTLKRVRVFKVFGQHLLCIVLYCKCICII